MKSLKLTIVFFLLSIVFAQAQKWSLKECIEYALNNNLTIQQSALNAELTHLQLKQNKFNLLPTVNGQAGQNNNFGRTVDPFTNQFTTQEINSMQLNINAGLTLFNGLQLQNAIAQSKLDYKAGKQDLEKVINDISLAVATAYLQSLFAMEQKKATELRLQSSSKQEEFIKKQVLAGVLPEGSLYDINAQVATEELAVLNAGNQVIQSLLTLRQLMNLDSAETEFNIIVPDLALPDQSIANYTAQQIYINALRVQPDVQSAETRVLSARKGTAIAVGRLSPQISMFGALGTGYSSALRALDGTPLLKGFLPNGDVTSTGDLVLSPDFDVKLKGVSISNQFDQNFNKSFGFSLQLPIFNGLSTQNSIKRAKLSVKQSELNLTTVQNNLFKNIQQAVTDVKAAQSRYDAAQKSANANKLAYNYADKRFIAGLATSLDFLNAKNNLARADSELLQARFDLIFKIKVLEFYNGNKLTL
ncbi:MAG: TolC family protein [Bacteroidetes bacterium]|nr:TolC family protein [Bacteroidota bacterium]